MDRALKAIARHPIQLLILMLLPVAIGSVVAYRLPRQYQATAVLWALHSYQTLTATAVDNSSLSTPAETQVTALSELLQSRSFSLAVAKEANLAETLQAKVRDDPQSRDNAMLADISQHVQVQAKGYDVFAITYTGTDPQTTQQVVAAVIDNYGQQSQHIIESEKQNLRSYQDELSHASSTLQSATAAASQYAQSHPQLTKSDLQNDPAYQVLQAQVQQAQSNVLNIQTSISALEQAIATHTIIAGSLFRVLDAPAAPSQPISRLKNLLLGAGAGLALGLIASALFIALTLRRDRRVYTASDLRKVIPHPVVMELPRLSPKTTALLAEVARPINPPIK